MQAYQLRDRKKPHFFLKSKRSGSQRDIAMRATPAVAKVNKELDPDLCEIGNIADPEPSKSTEDMIKDLWLAMKSRKDEVKGMNMNISSVKDDIKSNYSNLIEKIDGYKKVGEELESRVDLAHDRIATLENCYMDLYHENQTLKNKQKACNILIRGVPEQDREKMHQTIGDLLGAIGGNANYLLTDGAAWVGKYIRPNSKQGPIAGGTVTGRPNEPRPIRVFCNSLHLKGEIFRGIDKIKLQSALDTLNFVGC